MNLQTSSLKSQTQSARTLLYVFLFLAVLGMAVPASAQVDDEGEFMRGAQKAANSDSETVTDVKMGLPSFAGSGCYNTASATLSPDAKTLSVIFDNYFVEAGSGVRRDHAECWVNIPVYPPKGYSVQVTDMDYRGYASVPEGAQVGFRASFRTMGWYGWFGWWGFGNHVSRQTVFRGPADEDFTVSAKVKSASWSPCGQPFYISAQSQLVASARKKTTDTVYASIDSLDGVVTPSRLHLKWKKCK